MRVVATNLLSAVFAAVLVVVPARAQSPVEQLRPTLAASKLANFTLLDEPKPVPEVSFVDEGGRARTLADFQGKVVLLNLWATWCAPCRREMPTLDNLQARLGGDDFEVVALSIDRAGMDKVRGFLDDIGTGNLALYLDSSTRAMRALRVMGLPTTLLVDASGREVGRLIGPAEWDTPEAVALIRAVIAAGNDRPRAAAEPPS